MFASTRVEVSFQLHLKPGSDFISRPISMKQQESNIQGCFFCVQGTDVVTPRGSHAGGDSLTLDSESKELLLLVHPRQTLGCLANMDLHSQRETLPSQPAGNLEKCLILPQGTYG